MSKKPKPVLDHLYSKSAGCAAPSAIREINKLVDSPGMRSLAGGWPDPAVFPADDILQIANEQLDIRFPEQVRWNHPAGGFFIFVRLPEAMDALELLGEAIEHQVAFVAGEPFFIDHSGTHTFRLSYSQSDESVITEAVAELGKLIKKRLKE